MAIGIKVRPFGMLMVIWHIVWPFGIFMGIGNKRTAIWYVNGHLAYCMAIWYTFPRFGMLRQEKSGSPV
jgi:hypothetical protein